MFVYNKAAREDFHCENLSSMFCVTSTLFQHSRLKLKSKPLCGGQTSHFYFGRYFILQPVEIALSANIFHVVLTLLRSHFGMSHIATMISDALEC